MADRQHVTGEFEVDRLFSPLEPFAPIIAAVSGGSDSLAMLQLLARWLASRQAAARSAAPDLVVVATVDHGLRPESAREAAFVAAKAKALGLKHHTLRWEESKPDAGIAAAARAARYRLLSGLALALAQPGKSAAVVTAHTRDDVAETFFMRLARGSGLEGLSEMARQRPVLPEGGDQVLLVRPLLEVSRQQLVAVLEAAGETWIEDPSNARLDLERPRVRALLRRLQAEGLDGAAIARSAARLRRAQDAIEYAGDAFLSTLSLRIEAGVMAELDIAAFSRGPALLRERLLAQLIARFGGDTPQPRLSEIERLVARLTQPGEGIATLGGTAVSKGTRRLRVWREAGRISPAPVPLRAGEPHLWDRRFWVWVQGEVTAPVSVLPLGLTGVAELRPHLPSAALPQPQAAAALPAFFSQGRLIAVPGLAYHDCGSLQLGSEPASGLFCQERINGMS